MVRMLRFVMPLVVITTAFSQPRIDGSFDGEGVWGQPEAQSIVGPGLYGISAWKFYCVQFGDSIYLAGFVTGDAGSIYDLAWSFNINTVSGGGSSHPYPMNPLSFTYTSQPDYILTGTFSGDGRDWMKWNVSGATWDHSGLAHSPDVGYSVDYVEIKVSRAFLGYAASADIQFYVHDTYDFIDACPDDDNPLNNYAEAHALPVQLTTFKVEVGSNAATIVWHTATETKNAGFEIERRDANGQPSPITDWQRMGFISGHGTSNTPHEYSYTDANLAPGRYVYRLKQIDNDGSFSYSHEAEVEVLDVPMELALGQNFPNPFNPTTVIRYQVPVVSRAELRVYDLLGREVAELVNGMHSPGTYTVPFNGTSLASGTYVYRLQVNGTTMTKVMTLLR